MNKEFKKIDQGDVTRYVLESASGGGTGSGSVATVSKSLGGVQRRSNLLVQDTNQPLTPRSPVAHAAQKVAKGSGRHTDRKQQSKQVRGEKHKSRDFAENQDHEISMAGSELHSIFQNAKQLHTMIKTKSEEEGLDAWQQSKITKAADYLNSVLQSLQHEMMGEAHSPAQQAAIAIAKKKEAGVAEGGPFSYGKPPRKGSVVANAAQQRKEQDKKTPAIEPKDQKVGVAKVTKDVKENQLDELDRPSGKLFIIVKTDNAGATHVFGDFGSTPQDVMHKVSKRGTRDKAGVKTKLKIDFLFDNFRSTIQQLRTIFRDVDFVGAEAAEFIIHSSALRSDQGEDVKHLRDYIEGGDDRRMTMYQAPEEDDGEDGEVTGGNILRIDPETGAARKVTGVKPQTQMGGKSIKQPGMTTYRFKDARFAQQLRGMNLGFNIKGDSITVDQKQKQKLLSMLGDRFSDVFTNKELFKEGGITLPNADGTYPPGAHTPAGQERLNQMTAAQQSTSQPAGKIDYRKPGPITQSSLGHKLEYGIPVNDKGEFLNPNRLPNIHELPRDEEEAMSDAYKIWLADYLKRWPNATQRPDGSMQGIKPGLAPMYPKAPTNEDSYIESLSAALEQKLSVNDTPEVWRDDFEHADPVKYKQFRNKTVEKKHRMADVARYRQIQQK